MSEWLDLMLDEIKRKQQEDKEAAEELARRSAPETGDDLSPNDDQSK